MKISLYRFKSRLDTAKKKNLHKLENIAKQNHPQVYRRKNMGMKNNRASVSCGISNSVCLKMIRGGGI